MELMEGRVCEIDEFARMLCAEIMGLRECCVRGNDGIARRACCVRRERWYTRILCAEKRACETRMSCAEMMGI